MHPAEVVPHEVSGDGRRMVLNLLGERIGQPSEFVPSAARAGRPTTLNGFCAAGASGCVYWGYEPVHNDDYFTAAVDFTDVHDRITSQPQELVCRDSDTRHRKRRQLPAPITGETWLLAWAEAPAAAGRFVNPAALSRPMAGVRGRRES
jgi:hypothetical protein